jgi:uncharacterized protein involved in response to NO
MWLLWCLSLLFVFEGGATFAEMQGWRVCAHWRYLHAAVDLTAGLGLLVLARRSAAASALRLRMLAMLFAGFAWLGTSLVLAGAARCVGAEQAGAHDLELAATHAYTMGFLGSTMIAMVTRVASGHSGRTVAADDFVWRLFGLLQLAVVTRVLGGIVATVSAHAADVLISTAAILWAVACLVWSARCIAWYGLPRVDGREG